MSAWQQLSPGDAAEVVAILQGAKPHPETIRIPAPADIGPAVRQLRGELTQDRLALRSGVNITTVCNTEKGHSRAETTTLILLAAAMGYDLAFVPKEDA